MPQRDSQSGNTMTCNFYVTLVARTPIGVSGNCFCFYWNLAAQGALFLAPPDDSALESCLLFDPFHGQNLDFQKFLQKCLTFDTSNSAIDEMMCKLVQEITTNLAFLDLSEPTIEVFLQQVC